MPVIKKDELRSYYLKKRSEIESKESKSDSAARFILNSDEYKQCLRLFVYISTGGETDTAYILNRAFSDGKIVYAPRCEDREGHMSFRRINSFSELVKGMYSIYEPSPDSEICEETAKTDLCIVPGVSFDKKGRRLGYGKGYYDRFLSQFKGVAIGLSYEDCISNFIPTDEHDITLNGVCTEKGIYYNE